MKENMYHILLFQTKTNKYFSLFNYQLSQKIILLTINNTVETNLRNN